MLITYRTVYCVVLALFLGNVLSHFTTESPQTSVLLVATAVSVCGPLALSLAFFRIRPVVFWIVVLAWEAMFIWYAWFSPVAPFVAHEAHGLDPSSVAQEITSHRVRAGTIFAALSAWFLSLPIIRHAYQRRAPLHV
jgi:hypothetical protein